MIEVLVAGSRAPPKEVKGVSQGFLDGEFFFFPRGRGREGVDFFCLSAAPRLFIFMLKRISKLNMPQNSSAYPTNSSNHPWTAPSAVTPS